MSYIGNNPVTQNFVSGTDYFNGTGAQTAFTLSRTVASINDIQVTVNNVVQQPNDAYTISGTTLTMTSAPSAGTNNVYVRYLSTTTQAITPSQNTVSWNTLDSNIQQDLGVMGKNRIINGNMVIDQRNAGASVTPIDGQYTLDRFVAFASQASKYSVQQNAGSVTPPAGFTNYLGVTSLATTSLGAGDYFMLCQRIEGFNIADLTFGSANAKTVTLSFWVRSSLTGTFGGSIQNGNQNRAYPFTYTISAANTWEQKSITIAGSTDGTWNTTNGEGIGLYLSLGMGTTYSGTASAWTTSTKYSVTGATSVVGTNGATFYITGVQLEVGTQATAFSTAGGSYGAELALCQRYFAKSYDINLAPGATSGNNGGGTVITRVYGSAAPRMYAAFRVSMRAAPTVTIYNPYSGSSGNLSENSSSTNVAASTPQPSTEGFYAGTSGSVVTDRTYEFHYTASIEL